MGMEDLVHPELCAHDLIFKLDEPESEVEKCTPCVRCNTVVELDKGKYFEGGSFRYMLRCDNPIGYGRWRSAVLYMRKDFTEKETGEGIPYEEWNDDK